MKLRTLSNACCGFILMGILATGAQGAAKPGGDNPDGLLDPIWYTVQGTPTDNGGCAYSLSSDLPPGQVAIQQDVLSIDPKTCAVSVVQGTPPDASTYADPKGGSSESSDWVAVPAKGSPAVGTLHSRHRLAPRAQTTSEGYRKAWFEDPAHADVNIVKNIVKWTWNGSAVVGTIYCSDYRWWLDDTGWYPFYHDLNCGSGDSGQANSGTWQDYENDIFCGGNTTYAFYDRNHAWGWGDGHLGGKTDAVAAGSCMSMLHLKAAVVRTSG